MINAKNVHIIGIGGIGTSAVAKWWKENGANVTGSDVHKNEIIEELQSYDIDVRLGHFVENVPRECDLVIYSRAVPATNIERQIADERGILDISFPKFLGLLAKDYKTVAISGTNGKSTTTAMVAMILIEAGLDPTVIVGSKMLEWPNKNLRLGKGEWFITEACEHMASFLNIIPNIAIVTNIEEDHLDFYDDLNQIRETFQVWLDNMDNNDYAVINHQDIESQKLKVNNKIEFDVSNREIKSGKQIFVVNDVTFELSIPGAFNAMNAAAAIKMAQQVGINNEIIKKALSKFNGTWRRFESVGMWKGANIYSDYAHHPTAVEGSILAFKEFFLDRRLIVVFEPHQHSRTHELFNDFVKSFDNTDILILSEIYEVAGRTEEKFETSKDMVAEVKKRNTIDKVFYAENLKKAESHLRDIAKEGDIIVCMGAGSIDKLARKLV